MTSLAKYRKVSFLFDLAGKKEKKDNLIYTKEILNAQFFCPKLLLKNIKTSIIYLRPGFLYNWNNNLNNLLTSLTKKVWEYKFEKQNKTRMGHLHFCNILTRITDGKIKIIQRKFLKDKQSISSRRHNKTKVYSIAKMSIFNSLLITKYCRMKTEPGFSFKIDSCNLCSYTENFPEHSYNNHQW